MTKYANVVRFKSVELNFNKEKSGIKSNTLRKIDMDDPRFIQLYSFMQGTFPECFIEIECVESGEVFSRMISDITEWEGFLIISWIHFK